MPKEVFADLVEQVSKIDWNATAQLGCFVVVMVLYFAVFIAETERRF